MNVPNVKFSEILTILVISYCFEGINKLQSIF